MFDRSQFVRKYDFSLSLITKSDEASRPGEREDEHEGSD
jgi:hypothetical protein